MKEQGLSEKSLPVEIKRRLRNARCLTDLETRGFKFEENGSGDYDGRCTFCNDLNDPSCKNGSFSYQGKSSFGMDEVLSSNFRTLKGNIRRHIVTAQIHAKSFLDDQARRKCAEILSDRNKEAGLHLGRIAMKCYLKGRPYIDFEDDVLLLAKSGAK